MVRKIEFSSPAEWVKREDQLFDEGLKIVRVIEKTKTYYIVELEKIQ
jgi:hypothetical protein